MMGQMMVSLRELRGGHLEIKGRRRLYIKEGRSLAWEAAEPFQKPPQTPSPKDLDAHPASLDTLMHIPQA